MSAGCNVGLLGSFHSCWTWATNEISCQIMFMVRLMLHIRVVIIDALKLTITHPKPQTLKPQA